MAERPIGEATCSVCGAPVPTESPICWLCYASLGDEQDSGGKPNAPPSNEAHTGSQFSLASLMMLVTLIAVVLGLSTVAPGIGILLGVILAVVWLRTAAVMSGRRKRGIESTRADAVSTFFSSLGVAVMLILLTCIADCAAFFAACFACAFAVRGGSEQTGMLVFGVVVAGVVIPVVIWMGRYLHGRWRRDIGEGA